MLRGVSELQYIRQAILTIPVSQLPIIPVSYPTPNTDADTQAVQNDGQTTQTHAVVSGISSERGGRLELLA